MPLPTLLPLKPLRIFSSSISSLRTRALASKRALFDALSLEVKEQRTKQKKKKRKQAKLSRL